jgi:acyl-coenzyme A thioesterase PaaI-like protein
MRRISGVLGVRRISTLNHPGSGSRNRLLLYSLGGLTLGGFAGYYVDQGLFFSAIPARDEDAREYRAELERKLRKLAIVKNLQADGRYKEFVSWHRFDKEKIGKIFTAGTLSVPGGLTLSPLVFVDPNEKKTIAVVHCGHRLVGLPMMIHGGVIGTLLDEALARTAFLSTNGTGVTANLKINYKRPTIAHQFLVIKTHTDNSQDDRKAWVSGTVETLDGQVLVDASALFVAPKTLKLQKMSEL